ncbi:YceI family protein [Acetobacter oeni]|uniref:Polyisoprenoid-binding protein n=1 Tax=Acetobacter oeni TaxID=304077 RepID=A0A511XK17_9PROT|nr:YceI family protein [Acetobacter oeni]MBB3883105.1 polyisoprenoid-binding protein YceI [Acetobacter oeni]NHO19253.1 polyisoprenoid-binding protein [Acetobacter oeni]GEN63286.1 polyisoprenoid-binding protein [Acetobacter oeni]
MKTPIRNTAFAAFALTVLVSGAQAAPLPQDVQGGSYKVETGHTQVIFSVLHLGFTNYSGLFSGATGTLKFDPAHIAASRLTITFPVNSVSTTSDMLTGELRAPDWFDVSKYPTATFVSTNVVSAESGDADVEGNLTLHGVTKPVILHAHFIGSGINPMDKAYTLGFQATATIRRSEFGISKYVPMVGDDVTLTIAGAFEKQS